MVNKIFKTILFLLIFYLTFVVRASGYDRTPGFGHLEELLFSWSGIYLVEEGVPISWSTLDYPQENIIFKGQIGSKHTPDTKVPVNLVRPWLDEPPLYSLIVGWTAHWLGADRHEIIPSSYARVPSVIFATICAVLIFLLARNFFGYWVGIGSMLLYGTIPTIVFGSRLAVPENFFALSYLLSLILVVSYINKPRLIILIVLIMLSGLSGLMKPTGFFIAGLMAFLLARKSFWKEAIALVVLQLPFVGIFIAYGVGVDKELFWRLVQIQGFRPVGWSSLPFIFSTPGFDIWQFFDGWYVFAMLSVAYFILLKNSDEKIRLLNFALVYWLIIVILSGGQQDMLPWYRFPIFPFLAIFATLALREIIINPNLVRMALVVGMMLSSRHYLSNAFRADVSVADFRLRFSLLMVPSLLQELWYKPWLVSATRLALVTALGVGIFWNIKLILHFFDIRCESLPCGFGPTTWLSEVYFPWAWRLFRL